MESNQNMLNSNKVMTNSFNLKKTLFQYLKQWKWFVFSVLICLSASYFYLRYTTPLYRAWAKIMIIPENDNSVPGAVLNDLSPLGNNTNSEINDEILVFQSNKVLKNVIKNLNLNVQYFTKGRVLEVELYKSLPIDINFIDTDSILDKVNLNIDINVTSDKDFLYKLNEADTPKTFSFGDEIATSFGSVVVTPKIGNINNLIGSEFRVQITPLNNVVNYLKDKISISQSNSDSRALYFSLKDPIPQKAKDILNNLIFEYDEYATELKNIRANNTADFIDSRIQLIASDLVNVDDSIVRFKTGNKLTNVASEAGNALSSSVQIENTLTEFKTQLRLLNYMTELLGSDINSLKTIPSNLGLGDGTISALAVRYNELLVNRERLLRSAGEKNMVVVELDQTLNTIKQSLRQSIANSKKALNIQIISLENQSSRVASKIFSAPGQESKLRGIERKQGIKESLYLYLLQKREETAISLTATAPNLKILDEAYDSGSPVEPEPELFYIGALFIGLFLPFGVIYIADLLDTKIHNKEDLQNIISNIPILGEIPSIKRNYKYEKDLLVKKNDRSILSESFRIVRTNFDYVKRGRDIKNYGNVVFVTSTIKGEGKSFFSINTALTIANSGKRVLLIGADIRNPQISNLTKNSLKLKKNPTGLTEFLAEKSILTGEIIDSYSVNDIKIDLLFSGITPPNPAELLMKEARLKELFDYASKQYDIVIVDTAPSMIVTDTLLLSQFAGHTIYLTRAGYTDKQILNFAKELHANNKLNGMMLVVNDVKQSNFGYGAKYGYYSAPEKKSWFGRKKA